MCDTRPCMASTRRWAWGRPRSRCAITTCPRQWSAEPRPSSSSVAGWPHRAVLPPGLRGVPCGPPTGVGTVVRQPVTKQMPSDVVGWAGFEPATFCVPNGSAALPPGTLPPTAHQVTCLRTHVAPPTAERWRKAGWEADMRTCTTVDQDGGRRLLDRSVPRGPRGLGPQAVRRRRLSGRRSRRLGGRSLRECRCVPRALGRGPRWARCRGRTACRR
jgi:hypothetical protein